MAEPQTDVLCILDAADRAFWEAYVANGCIASTLATQFGLSPSQCRRKAVRLKHLLCKELGLRDPEDIERQNLINELIEEQNIPEEALAKGRVTAVVVNKWGNEQDPNRQTKVFYKFDGENETPKFPLIQPANPSTFVYADAPRILRKIRRETILSDAQIGFLLRDGEMVPTHDPDAMSVAKQLIHDFAPDGLSWIGDWVDLPMFSRWPKTPEQVATTQASIQAGHDLAGDFIVAAGPRCTKRRFVKGNHDDRFALWARDHNLEAMTLRRASDTTGWPVFSTEFLLRFDELGIELSAPYPSGTVWLADDLALMHAPPKKLEMAASVIHGHLHKLTRTTWAQTNRDGRLTYFLYDVGCLCKVDGTVPSDRARTDWAQGLAFVEIIDGKIPLHRVEQIHIDNGRALYGGKLYEAQNVREQAA